MLDRRSPMPALALGLLSLFFPAAAQLTAAQERYYLIVFANQGAARDPRFAHTFATFVRARSSASSGNQVLEVHTISWMPASQRTAIFRLFPEPGALYDLQLSLAWAYSVHATVSTWGPYEIEKELYKRAVAQGRRLRAGGVQFKTVDGRFRPNALNCVHAVSDIDTDQGRLHAGLAWGEAASHQVVRHLARWIIDPEQTHPWVGEQLGLGRYPMVQRSW
jgi:hypothetical protein